MPASRQGQNPHPKHTPQTHWRDRQERKGSSHALHAGLPRATWGPPADPALGETPVRVLYPNPPLAFEGHYQGAHCPRPAYIKLDTRSLRRGSPCREHLCLPLPDPATRRTPAPCGLRALSENTKHQTFFSLPNERRNKWPKG